MFCWKIGYLYYLHTRNAYLLKTYFLHAECQVKIYFSGIDGVKTYDCAVDYCDQLPGRLLPYGKEVVNAARNEGMSGSAWVGKPWFKNFGK